MWSRFCILVVLFLAACGTGEPLPTLLPTAVLPPPASSPALPQALPPTLTPFTDDTVVDALSATTRTKIAADTAVPAEMTAVAQKIAQQNLTTYTWVELAEADVRLVVDDGRTANFHPLSQWVYTVAAPFATVADGLTFTELQTNWQGTAPGVPILVTEGTRAAMTSILGQSGPSVQIVAEEELVEQLWARPSAITILPFHQLTPELKLLSLDGVSPLAHEFEVSGYPLVVKAGVTGEATAVAQFLTLWDGPATNRDPAKLSRIAMSGVTALVRATAFNMEQSGILWPGEEVGPILRQADIAHISNEVSFAPDCPYPDPIGGTTFCSRDRYFDLILDMGTDVIELTGNHLNDWGRANTLYTLDKYDAAGLATYGGGRDLAGAAEPATFEHNGNRIAFVGCNSFGPAFSWAEEAQPGAMPCDGSLPGQIAELRQQGYLVLASLQYTEFYQYAPTADQEAFFKGVADAGATAVSGSQGHHAQGFAFHNGAFIHYGLGNLFFDQMDSLGTRQSFVDTYVVYDGRLLNVELWTGLIENYARPRVMTPDERAQALTAVFQASGWGN